MRRTLVVAGVFLALGFGAGVLVTRRGQQPLAVDRAPEVEGRGGPPRTGDRDPGAAHHEQAARLGLAATKLARAAANAPPRLTTAPAAAQERPQKLTLEQVPGPVRDVVKSFVAGRHVGKLNFETRLRKGEVHYRLDTHLDGIDHNMVFDERGTLRDSDIDITASDVPDRVQQSIQKAYPGAVVIKGKKKEGTEWPVPLYEVEILAGDDRRRLRITDAGQTLRDRPE